MVHNQSQKKQSFINEFLQEKLTVHETAKVCSDYKWEEKHKYDLANRTRSLCNFSQS